MTYITEKSEFAGDDVPLLDTSTPVKGYDGTSIGPANEQAQVLANRTVWLKEKGEATDETVSNLTDATEKLKLGQSSLDKRLTQVSSDVSKQAVTIEDQATKLDKVSEDVSAQAETIESQGKQLTQLSDNVNKNSTTLEAQGKQLTQLASDVSTQGETIETQGKKLTQVADDVSAQGDTIKSQAETIKAQGTQIKELDERESNDFQSLVIGLGQATTDIATNGAAIRNLESGIEDLNNTALKLEDNLDQVQSNVDTLTKTVDSVSKSKQDKLESGKNVNTVLGASLVDVRENGITLSDADDFAKVMSQRLSVGDGLSLELSDDEKSLILKAIGGGSGITSAAVIKKVTTTTGSQEVEFKTKQRPSFNMRAVTLRSEPGAIKAQSNLTVNFITDPNTQLSSPYTGGQSNRINFVPDASSSARWSTIKTLTIPQATNRPDTRIAFSPDGVNWKTYVSDEWVDLGQLKVDNTSATVLYDKGMTLRDFSMTDIAFLTEWLKGQENVPGLYLAFAAKVSDIGQVFVPDKMVITFDQPEVWTSISPYYSPVYLTKDSIIFKPTKTGDYVLVYEFMD